MLPRYGRKLGGFPLEYVHSNIGFAVAQDCTHRASPVAIGA
jgi:hypothetical protein